MTAIAGLGMTLWTALAYQRDVARTGLIPRVLIAVYWSWIVVLGVHLVTTMTSATWLPSVMPRHIPE